MKQLNPQKVFVQYRDDKQPYGPTRGRKYTITHSDVTADLFVFVAADFALDQVTYMKDEVRVEWVTDPKGNVLKGWVEVDNGPDLASRLRSEIFTREMPTALQALRRADRFLFERHPVLDKAPVIIEFRSQNPDYQKTVNYGPIGRYQ